MSQSVPEFGGCPWPLDQGCLDQTKWDEFPQEVRDRSVALASATLTRLTGGRVSNCPRTVRPCVRNNRTICFVPFEASLSPWYPTITPAGTWVNACGCQGQHTCATGCEVPLPPPVGRVDEVKVDGSVIDPTDYRVDGNLLVWMGTGDCPWPDNQALSLPDTEVGTFSVTYLNAYPVDQMGAYAAATLAFEYAKACTSKGTCRLPAGVKSIVRQGVNMEIVSGAFPGGNTGIREVDVFVALWNPRHLTGDSRVWTPS